MDNNAIAQAIFTAALSLIGGVVLVLITDVVKSEFLQPLRSYRALEGEIEEALLFYANAGSSLDGQYVTELETLEGKTDVRSRIVAERLNRELQLEKEDRDQASKTLRKLAVRLLSTTNAIPWYPATRILWSLPPKPAVFEAAHALIGMSNSLGHPINLHELSVKVENLLKLEDLKRFEGR